MPAAFPLIMPSSWQDYIRGSGNRTDEFIINSLYIAASSNHYTSRVNTPVVRSGSVHQFFISSGFPSMGYSMSSGFYPTGISPTGGLLYYRITKI